MSLFEMTLTICLLMSSSYAYDGAIKPGLQDTLRSAQVSPVPEVVIKGTAGPGDKVKLAGESTWADTSGRWILVYRKTGRMEADSSLPLCLERSGLQACTTIRPRNFDTLELAPLLFTDSSAVTTPTSVDSARVSTRNPVLVEDEPAIPLRRIVVKGRRRYRAPGQNKIGVDASKRMPSLGEPDLIRAVQSQAGVASSSDFSTKLYVRGSPSDQNLILLDNAVVYSPNHFGGLFSSFLADATGGMDFYKGGFEPRYGNRLSSVLLVDSKTGGAGMDSANLGKASVQGVARFTLFSGSLETDGRMGNWSWALGGRRLWWDKATELFEYFDVTDYSLDYNFSDIQGNLAWGNLDDTVKISLYRGNDHLNFSPLRQDWGNTVVPLNVRKRLFDDILYRGALSYSEFSQTMAMSEISNTSNFVKSVNSRQELEYNGLRNHTLTAGYEFDWYRIEFLEGSKALDFLSRERYEVPLHSGYLQDRWSLGSRNIVTFGLRGYYYPEIDHIGLDPRFAYTFLAGNNWRLDYSIGHYTQFLTSVRIGDTENFNELWYAARGPMRPTTSIMTSAGLEKSEFSKLRLNFSVQGYYKEIRNIPLHFPNRSAGEVEEEDGNTPSFSRNFSSLDGYVLGSEFSLRRDQGRLTWDLSYGLSQAVLKQRPFHSSLRNSEFSPYFADWDQPHTVKASATINWKGDGTNSIWKHKKKGYFLRSQLQLNYHTGQPYTGYDNFFTVHEPAQGADGGISSGLDTFADGNVYADPGIRNGSRKPDYLRLDATLIERGREGKWRFYWTILNVLNRENPLAVQIDQQSNPPKKSFVNQLPLIPVFIGYEYEF